MFHPVSCLIIVALILVHGGFGPRAAHGQTVKAFPTAEGFGANAVGGRGGRVIEVTNLNDSGTWGLREAVTQTGPRIVVCRVRETIELQSTIYVTQPYLTIAGQTSPGGIQLRGTPNVST